MNTIYKGLYKKHKDSVLVSNSMIKSLYIAFNTIPYAICTALHYCSNQIGSESIKDQIYSKKLFAEKDIFKNYKETSEQRNAKIAIEKLKISYICKEALRLSSTKPETELYQTLEPVEICNVQIPKNTVIGIDASKLHSDAEIWSEPNTFIPDRFDPESEFYCNTMKNQDNLSFIPFGLSPNKTFYEKLMSEILLQFLSRVKYEVSRDTVGSVFKKSENHNKFYAKVHNY